MMVLYLNDSNFTYFCVIRQALVRLKGNIHPKTWATYDVSVVCSLVLIRETDPVSPWAEPDMDRTFVNVSQETHPQITKQMCVNVV